MASRLAASSEACIQPLSTVRFQNGFVFMYSWYVSIVSGFGTCSVSLYVLRKDLHTYVPMVPYRHTWPLAKSLEPHNATNSIQPVSTFKYSIRTYCPVALWQWPCGEQHSTISGSVLRNPVVPYLPTRQFELIQSHRLIRSLPRYV